MSQDDDKQRELLREALDALLPFAAQTRASGPTEERNIRRARAAADKIRAAACTCQEPAAYAIPTRRDRQCDAQLTLARFRRMAREEAAL